MSSTSAYPAVGAPLPQQVITAALRRQIRHRSSHNDKFAAAKAHVSSLVVLTCHCANPSPLVAGSPIILTPSNAVRPWWQQGRLIDLPGVLARVGEDAGFVLFERNVALLVALRGPAHVRLCPAQQRWWPLPPGWRPIRRS